MKEWELTDEELDACEMAHTLYIAGEIAYGGMKAPSKEESHKVKRRFIAHTAQLKLIEYSTKCTLYEWNGLRASFLKEIM